MHNDDMVRKAVIHEIITLIYANFKDRCVTLGEVVNVIKSKYNVSYSLVKLALETMAKDGKVVKAKLHDFYTIYCVGKAPRVVDIADRKKIEECISRHMQSFGLATIAECVLGRKPVAPPIPIYIATLYVLSRMVREKKIYSFTVLRDARDRLKVVIQK